MKAIQKICFELICSPHARAQFSASALQFEAAQSSPSSFPLSTKYPLSRFAWPNPCYTGQVESFSSHTNPALI